MKILFLLLFCQLAFATPTPIREEKPAAAIKKIEGLGLTTQPMAPPKPIESCQPLSRDITFYRCETSEVICYVTKPSMTCWAKQTGK